MGAVQDSPWAGFPLPQVQTGAEKYFIKNCDYFPVSFWQGNGSISKKV